MTDSAFPVPLGRLAAVLLVFAGLMAPVMAAAAPDAKPAAATASAIKHRFVATDESRKQLLLVDQTDPSKDWTVPLPGNRDIRLIGTDRVLVSVPNGYREYALADGRLVNDHDLVDLINSNAGAVSTCALFGTMQPPGEHPAQDVVDQRGLA